MKKNYLIVMLALVCNFAMAQVQQTSYRGAFAPAPTTMWTQGWTNFDPNQAVYGTPTVQITADITSNTTWTSGNIYQLNGLITVRNNATLTIQPGTVIRSAQAATALLISRGAKLIANGTAAQPIVFTSNKAAGSRLRGDWGGIVMLGKARYNLNNGVNYIEGISQTAITEFGGGLTPDDNDNSGILRYVRIEFGGYVFAPNNELNGLTMGAVGKGTTIENVQVSYSNDDSFEWFGGSVNCKNLVAFAGLDDDFDVDNGYKGIVQFGLSVKDPLAADISTSEIFEVDNNAGGTDTTASYGDFTSAIFSNITAIGPNKRPDGAGGFVSPNPLHDKSLRLRRASRVNIYNSIFLDSRRGLSLESGSTNTAYGSGNTARFKNNLIASPIPFLTDGTTTFTLAANANVSVLTSSTGILTNAYNATSGTNFKLIGEGVTPGTIDYRPASTDATTGADFTDDKLAGLLVIGNAPGVTAAQSYCKGVVAPALTANLTANGVSLRWYSVSTTPTPTTAFTTTGPVPSTSTVGPKSYYVREVDTNGAVSNAATIVVTTVAAPTVALGLITSTVTSTGAVATAAVGPYINTATTLTYTVPASLEGTVTSYLWTVPAGANIISGQGTNTITVNYLNVPAGVLKVGNISVQARNAALCGGTAKTLAITAALPAAPGSVKLSDPALPLVLNAVTGISAPKALTGFGEYMGTSKSLVLTAAPVVGASRYVWELPTGVNLLPVGTASTTTLYYNLFPFITPSTTAPTAAGNVFYSITTIEYTDGTKVQTGRIRRNARSANVPLGITALTAFDNPLTNLTNEGVTINPAYPLTTTTSNVINVNFAGVTNLTAFAYDVTSASTGAITPTYAIRIGAKSLNGVGASVTANATAVNPATASTAKQLLLKAVAAKAPAKLVMTDGVSPTAVTAIGKFVGTTTPFTLTAALVTTASSYQWELPAGVNQLSGGNSNVITVNFAGVTPGTTNVYVGVKGVNGIGASVTSNALLSPATTSTAKLLKLAAAVPAVVGTVTGQIAGVCGGSSYSYSFPASPLANTYVITAPTGSVVTSASNPANATEVLTTVDTAFTITYPAVFVASVSSPKSFSIAAVNGVGTSTTNKVVALSTAMPAIGIATPTSYTRATPVVVSVPAVVGAVSYTWVAIDGAVITAGQGTNSVTVDFSGVLISKTSNKLTVVATNACGIATAIKAITLSNAAPGARMSQTEALTVSTTEVYPNPVSSDFNIDVTASAAGILEISIYSLDGTLVVSPKSVQLQEGANTISENISDLNSGIYILQLVNSSNNEVITKKLIKE